MVASVRAAVLVVVALVVTLPGTAASAQAPGPAITAEGSVVWDPADDTVLSGRAPQEARPMASTTKIMTVLLALEAGTLGDVVTVSEAAAALGRVPGGATLNLRAGQQVPMADLLAALMLRSGNDAALAVAEHVAGSDTAFVARMNARAAELAMDDTNFVNASGLTNDLAHHSSPVDLARLAEVAMAIPEFAGWAGAATLQVDSFGLLRNRNELLFTFPGATGVKTGFTSLAGQCLVASATRDGRTVYTVVLGSQDYFGDSAVLLSYGLDAWRRPTPLAAEATATVYRWGDAEVALEAAEELARTVPVDATATWRTVLEPVVSRPLPAGAQVGRAELVVDGEVVDSTQLFTGAPVPAPQPSSSAAAAGAAVEDAVRSFLRLESFARAA